MTLVTVFPSAARKFRCVTTLFPASEDLRRTERGNMLESAVALLQRYGRDGWVVQRLQGHVLILSRCKVFQDTHCSAEICSKLSRGNLSLFVAFDDMLHRLVLR